MQQRPSPGFCAYSPVRREVPVMARKPKVVDKGGRPTKYRAEYARQVKALCLLGYSDAKIGVFFGVNEATVNRWKKSHPEFLASVREGKDVADGHVVSALMHRALGYSHPEVDVKVVNGTIVKTELVKHYPPDTAAAVMWLTNRQPDHWKAKRAEQADDEGDAPVPVKVVVEVKDARKDPAS